MPRLTVAALIVFGVATAFYVTFRKLERSPPVQPEYRGEGTAIINPAPTGPTPAGIADIDTKRPAIEAAVRGFFQARTMDDKLVHCRDTGRVRPLAENYYSRRDLAPRPVKGLGTCASVAETGYRLGYVEVLFEAGKPVHVIVEESGDAAFHVDWESLVLYGEMEWRDFLATRPTAPVLLRVLADQTTVAGGTVLTLRQPGQKGSVTAKIDPQNPEMRSLMLQLEQGGGKNVPLTLRLCYSEPKINPDHVRIVSCEGKGWMMIQ